MSSSLAAILILACAACAKNTPLIPAPGSAPPPRDVAEIQDLGTRLGLEPTGNFHSDGEIETGYCFYTGKLRLPDDYSGLWYKAPKTGECRVNQSRYDLFHYEPEAVAGVATPVGEKLREAAPGRRSFVVPHEDFHDQPGIRPLPPALKEAAATLAGLLIAAEYQVEKHGAGSREARRSRREIEIFSKKSVLVNTAYDRLEAAYKERREGGMSRGEALAAKERVFSQLRADCERIRPLAHAFDACPAALNNAGLVFDVTYTRYYPGLIAVHEGTGRDARRTLELLREELPMLASRMTPREALAGLAAKAAANPPQNSGAVAPPKETDNRRLTSPATQAPRSSR